MPPAGRTNIGPASRAAASAARAPRIRLPKSRSHRESSGNVARTPSRSTSPANSPASSGATRASVASSPSLRRRSAPSGSSSSGGRARRTRSAAARSPPRPRQARPPRELLQLGGDAERGGRQGREPPFGPRVGAARARLHELETELAAEVGRPGLARDERVRAGLEIQIPDPRRAQAPARPPVALQDGHLERGIRAQQPIRGGEAGDAGSDDDDAVRHAAAAARRARTTSASISTKAGSAFGISVRTSRIPASAAMRVASTSRS